MLMQNNKINLNLQNSSGWSPFSYACWNDKYESVVLMLQDPRVDVNLVDSCGLSPLMRVCYSGYTKIVELLFSSGRYVDLHKKSIKDDYPIKSRSTALDLAKERNKTDIMQLLEQYQNNKTETQKTLRNQLNLKGKE